MRLLKCIGMVLLFLIHVALMLAGLTLNITLTFVAMLAGAYMRS